MKHTRFCARTATILVAGGALLLAIWALADFCYLQFGLFPIHSSEPSSYQIMGRMTSFATNAVFACILSLFVRGLWKFNALAWAIMLMLSGTLFLFCMATLQSIGLDTFGAWPFTVYCLTIFGSLLVATPQFLCNRSIKIE